MLFPSHCSVDLSSKLLTNIRPLYNSSQLAEHPIEYIHDWELREHWISLRARSWFFLARLSRFKFEAFPRIDSQYIAWNNLFILSFVLPFVLYFVWKLISGWSDHSNIYISKNFFAKEYFTFYIQHSESLDRRRQLDSLTVTEQKNIIRKGLIYLYI